MPIAFIEKLILSPVLYSAYYLFYAMFLKQLVEKQYVSRLVCLWELRKYSKGLAVKNKMKSNSI